MFGNARDEVGIGDVALAERDGVGFASGQRRLFLTNSIARRRVREPAKYGCGDDKESAGEDEP